MGSITAVYPSSGPKRGCQTVTIEGEHLCNDLDDGDVSTVILNGYAVERLMLVSSTKIIVAVGDAGANYPGGSGPVVIVSKARGNSTSVDAPGTNYRYIGI